MMFNKKLYGRMPGATQGCYGCWEINLTWEDEMPGKIIHNMAEQYSFGPEKFTVMVEVEGCMVFGFDVRKEDSIV
jgi:hypothetical protein